MIRPKTGGYQVPAKRDVAGCAVVPKEKSVISCPFIGIVVDHNGVAGVIGVSAVGLYKRAFDILRLRTAGSPAQESDYKIVRPAADTKGAIVIGVILRSFYLNSTGRSLARNRKIAHTLAVDRNRCLECNRPAYIKNHDARAGLSNRVAETSQTGIIKIGDMDNPASSATDRIRAKSFRPRKCFYCAGCGWCNRSRCWSRHRSRGRRRARC